MLKISGLFNKQTDAKYLHGVFSVYGEVIESAVGHRGPGGAYSGFVLFDDYENAIMACKSLNDVVVNGDRLRLRHVYCPGSMRVMIRFRVLNDGMVYSVSGLEDQIKAYLNSSCVLGTERLQSFKVNMPLGEINTGIATYEDSSAGRASACRILTFLSGKVHAGLKFDNCHVLYTASDRSAAHCASLCASKRFECAERGRCASPVTVAHYDASLLNPCKPPVSVSESAMTEPEEEFGHHSLQQLNSWRVSGLSAYWVPSSLRTFAANNGTSGIFSPRAGWNVRLNI